MTKIDAKALDSPEHLLKQECYCIDLGSECAYCTAIKEVTSTRAMVRELEHQKRRLQGKVEDLAHSMKSLEARQVTRKQLEEAFYQQSGSREEWGRMTVAGFERGLEELGLKIVDDAPKAEGLFGQLSKEDQEKVLAYDGPETIGKWAEGRECDCGEIELSGSGWYWCKRTGEERDGRCTITEGGNNG